MKGRRRQFCPCGKLATVRCEFALFCKAPMDRTGHACAAWLCAECLRDMGLQAEFCSVEYPKSE